MRKVWIVEREMADDRTEIDGVYVSLNKAMKAQENVKWTMQNNVLWYGAETDGNYVFEFYTITEHRVIE